MLISVGYILTVTDVTICFNVLPKLKLPKLNMSLPPNILILHVGGSYIGKMKTLKLILTLIQNSIEFMK